MKKLKKLLAILAPMTIAIGGVSCSLVVSACKSDKDSQDKYPFSTAVNGNWKKYIPVTTTNYIHVVSKDGFVVNNKTCNVTAVGGLTWASTVNGNGNITVTGTPTVNGPIELTITIEDKVGKVTLTIEDNQQSGFSATMNAPSPIWTCVNVPSGTYIQLTGYNNFNVYNQPCAVNVTGGTDPNLTFSNSVDAMGRVSITGVPTNYGNYTLTAYINGIQSSPVSLEIRFAGNSDGTNWQGYESGRLSVVKSDGKAKIEQARGDSTYSAYSANDLIIPEYCAVNGEVLQVNEIDGADQSPYSVSAPRRFWSASSFTLPDSVTKIYGVSFKSSYSDRLIINCNLSNVSIVGASAFECCEIPSLNLNNVTNIGEKAFNYCEIGSCNLNLSNAIYIGAGAFRFSYSADGDAAKIGSLDLSSATTIGESAFNSCVIGSLVISDLLQSVGARAFASTQIGSITASYNYQPSWTIPWLDYDGIFKDCHHLPDGEAGKGKVYNNSGSYTSSDFFNYLVTNQSLPSSEWEAGE